MSSLSVSFVKALGNLSLNRKKSKRGGLRRRHVEECESLLESTRELINEPPADYLTMSNHIKFVESVFTRLIAENKPFQKVPLLVEIEYWLYVRQTFGSESGFLCDLKKIESILMNIINESRGQGSAEVECNM